jgi:hypothetical protein
VFVDLISKTEGIKLTTKTGNVLKLVAGKDFSCGIVWIADNDRFGVRVERRP